MAAGKPHSDHEEMRVHVEQMRREVLPAVELEKKEIKMRIQLPVQQAVPSIVMTTVENGRSDDRKKQDADRVVGITSGASGELATVMYADHPKLPQTTQNGERGAEIPERSPALTPPSPKLGSRLTVEQSHSIIEKTEDLMEFFEGKKTEKKLTKRGSGKKPRTPSPSPVRQSVGLDHLDNLVRLMEQLGSLRDENSRLKNRCDYLESTKSLLIAKSNLEDDEVDEPFESNSLPRTKKSRHKSVKSHDTNGEGPRLIRPRLPSAEDAKCLKLDIRESSSDQALQCNKSKLMKRSFSTGSLEVPSDITEQSGEDDIATQRLLVDPFEGKRSPKLTKSPEIKRKTRFSKWAKVKKVLNKQQLSENISSGIKSIKGFGKGAYLRYGSVSGRELTVPAHSTAESRSVDSGVGSGVDSEYQDVRRSTSSNEPPSPTRFIERHIDVPTPQVDDIEGIWLGPPEWIEKEREKEKELLKQTATTLSESPKSEPGDILCSPNAISGYEEGEKFLQIPLPRRQSSPLLVESPDEDDTDHDVKRTLSCKDQDLSKSHEDSFHKSDRSEKKHRTPWGKMKNIIHTRKDSGKRKHKASRERESDSLGFEEVSETDQDIYDDLKYVHDYLEGPVDRSTPKASPVVFRQKQDNLSPSTSPPGSKKDDKAPRVAGGVMDVSALLGGVSDEFTRKLQEWEELKVKRSTAPPPAKVASAQGQKRDSQIEHEYDSSSDEMEEATTPPERGRQSINVAEIQLKLSDSFSRKMEEWERQKYRRSIQSEPVKPVSKERPKSKKTKEEKEREKLEKLREREMLRVEREEQKLEKEKLRIEKERLRALEREAKIEKMKGRLSQPDMESKFKNPVLSPLSEYKVTTDFARKLHEWEVLKGKDSKDHSTAMYLEAQKRSLQFSREYRNANNLLRKSGDSDNMSRTETDGAEGQKTSSDSEELFTLDESEREEVPRARVRGEKPPPLTLIPCYDTPEQSPGAPLSDDSSLDENLTETTDSMTAANITSLEKANNKLLEQLRQTELEYNSLQDEVRVLNDKLINFRNEHVLELDLYKQQLVEGQAPGEFTFDTKHMSQTLTHLENKISELKRFGEQLAMSMEGAAVGKFQTVEGEESINDRLVDLLDKMRLLLQQAAFTGENTLEEVSKKSSALHNFEKLYSQAMQLQMQMNNLRLSQLERNKEIMNMKRHLLLQEANNLLLQADVTRREAELLYYKEYSQRRTPIKRWNTYSGKEDRARAALPEAAPTKESIFQRVQRLRSARQMLPSTTDSDSDESIQKSPPRRESPRIRKRESPKMRKKESPGLRRRDSPSLRRKERESPLLQRRESPKYASHQYRDMGDAERSTDRKEEYVMSGSSDILSWTLQKPNKQTFQTVTLPTAKVLLPKDISPQEMNGVPRKSRISTIYEQKELEKKEPPDSLPLQKAKGAESKFPELLIPEWKKQMEAKKRSEMLQRFPSIDRDDVFDAEGTPQQTTPVSEQAVFPIREKTRLMVEKSFDSETSEDTLKYRSPDASPAPDQEPPKFPTEISVIRRNVQEPIETASDPGQSRPNSMIHVSVETHGTPLLLRKPLHSQLLRGQRPDLQIPVIPLKKIKPAQELLEESKRYRSGQSVYLTRILKRYPMKIECRSRELEKEEPDKENIKAGYVKAMVKQLSREGTPVSKGSPKLPPKGMIVDPSESPKPQYVSRIVKKWPSQEEAEEVTEKRSSPLRDLTNGGQVQKLKQAFDSNGRHERTYSETLVVRTCRSQDSQSLSSSSTASTVAFSPLGPKGEFSVPVASTGVTYSSMPVLSLEMDEGRERSSTASSASKPKGYSPLGSPSQRKKIHVAVSMSPNRSRRVIDPSLSPARMRRLIDPASPGRRRRMQESSPIEIVQEEPFEASVTVAQSHALPSGFTSQSVTLRSPKSKRKDKSKMGTIEVLCRQSMTFDLGITEFDGSRLEGVERGAEGGDESEVSPVRLSTSSTTSASSQSEVEGATGERKKSKHKKFMDSAFIQKSKRFFKVSK